MKHTPGPWKEGDISYVWNSPSSPVRRILSDRGEIVAEVRQSQFKETVGAEEYKSNARLIAAAPEMYEALKNLLSRLDEINPPNGPFWSGSLDQEKARAILAKVEK